LANLRDVKRALLKETSTPPKEFSVALLTKQFEYVYLLEKIEDKPTGFVKIGSTGNTAEYDTREPPVLYNTFKAVIQP
jgi:hypothetical protein